ncbi:MAG: PQQ-binding-like beta-propeller repeat protein [Bacteroidota bacterium]
MVRNKLIIGILALVSVNTIAQRELKSIFPQKWNVKIGVSTYRTNMVLHDGKIFIGSNGEDRNFKNDALDGVYEIDAKTGKILHHYEIPFSGDNDVNGVAIGDGKLFFGTDNYYFFCFDIKSKQELWKFHTPYDVESCPQLAYLNDDKSLDVAFNVEGNNFYALNGVTGELLWESKEISSNSGNASPLKYDINSDGVMDFITSGRGESMSDEIDGYKMDHYGDYNFAIDGKTGKVLWKSPTGSGVHSSPFLYQNGAKTQFLFLSSYGELSAVDKKGNLFCRIFVSSDNFSSPSVTKDKHLVIGRGSQEFDDKQFYYDTTAKYNYIKNESKFVTHEVGERLSATTMIADVLAKNSDQLIGVTEDGFVFISKTTGEKIENFKIPAGAEASLFIEDIDGDKFLEILIADLAGNLTCYKTKSKAKATYGKFR